MAYYQDRQTSVGELLNGTFNEVWAIKREIAIYLGAFFAVGVLADLLPVTRSVVGLGAFAGYFVGQYWLYREALTRGGVVVDPNFKVFSMMFMAILLVIPIYIGAAFLVVPGVLLASKWIMAPTFLVAEENDLFQSIGQSWKASDNNLGAIAGTFTIIVIGWFFATAMFTAIGAGYEAAFEAAGMFIPSGSNNAFGWLGFHILPLMLMGLSITAYRALAGNDASVAAVFE